MAEAAEKLYTLTEVSKRTNISMPTLQRYKKLYQARIPSVGKGRSQRYPHEALDVFKQLKKENIGRRGRPRKTAKPAAKAPAKRGRKRAAKKAAAAKPAEGLLTLTQVGKMTGISYPTLLRYVKTNLKGLPHKGTGRARRFKPEAVAVFKKMRSESKRGRKPKAAKAAAVGRPAAKPARRRGRPPKVVEPAELLAMIRALEKEQRKLVRDVGKMQKKLGKQIKVVWR